MGSITQYAEEFVRTRKALLLPARKFRYWYTRQRFDVAPSNLHQVEGTTTYNRYPTLFQAAKSAAPVKRELDILSFGCSSGEECHSIRRYFPYANIVGADIHEGRLNSARNNNTDPRIRFVKSEPIMLRQLGSFDLIFVNSVLCKWPESRFVDDISTLLRFENFDKAIAQFHSLLGEDGCLVLYNSNFLLEESSYRSAFEPVYDPSVERDWVTKFDRNHRRLAVEIEDPVYIFRKLSYTPAPTKVDRHARFELQDTDLAPEIIGMADQRLLQDDNTRPPN